MERVRRITVVGRTSLEELQAIVRKYETTYGPLKAIARAARTTRLTFTKGTAPEQFAVLATYAGKTAARRRRHQLVLLGQGVVAGRATGVAVYRPGAIVVEDSSGRGEIEARRPRPVEDEAARAWRALSRRRWGSARREGREAGVDTHGWGGGPPRGWGGGPPRGTSNSRELS